MAAAARRQTIILVRHGESLGQAARSNGLNRKTDPSLVDADLTRKGESQASALAAAAATLGSVQVVAVSPLTRAIRTALRGPCVAAPAAPIVCVPGLRESGGTIPENRGRALSAVRRTVPEEGFERIDFDLLPASWPTEPARGHDVGGVAGALAWARSRPETTICFVCHHNTIQALLGDFKTRIENCDPLVTEFAAGTPLRLVRVGAEGRKRQPGGAPGLPAPPPGKRGGGGGGAAASAAAAAGPPSLLAGLVAGTRPGGKAPAAWHKSLRNFFLLAKAAGPDGTTRVTAVHKTDGALLSTVVSPAVLHDMREEQGLANTVTVAAFGEALVKGMLERPMAVEWAGGGAACQLRVVIYVLGDGYDVDLELGFVQKLEPVALEVVLGPYKR